MSDQRLVLSLVDYGILSVVLAISSAIGIYFQFFNKRTLDDYLLGGKDMSLLPVVISLIATFMPATIPMGLPAEIYLYGTNMSFMAMGLGLGPIISAYLLLPVFFRNNVKTVNEYLEKRFGRRMRRLASALSIVGMVLLTSATLFAPALALNAVTDLPMWMSIFFIGTVCTFYSTLGGMKAVVWNDAFQGVLMYAGIFVIIAVGCLEIGGVINVFNIAHEGGRLVFPSFSLDFRQHYTIFSIISASLIVSMSQYGSQLQVQRLLTLRNLNRARKASFLSAPMLSVFQLLCCMCGLVFYAYFQDCDPLSAPHKPIQSPDQLMPYFITSTMSGITGLPGLCISGIFCATLSTVSSAINCLAAITLQDFLVPLFSIRKRTVTFTKAISLLYGILCICLSFIITYLGSLTKMTVVAVSLIAGPNLAVFLLASCSTSANEEGALFGVIVGFTVSAYLSFASSSNTYPFLPLSNNCTGMALDASFENATFSRSQSTELSTSVHDRQWFDISYMWISSIGFTTTIIAGLLGSIIADICRGKSTDVPDIYLSPIRLWLCNNHRKTDETAEEKENLKNEKRESPVEMDYL